MKLIDFWVFAAISGVRIMVSLADFWMFVKMESRLAKNDSFCSLACCHSSSKDRSDDKRRDNDTATLVRSDLGSIMVIFAWNPSNTWRRTVLAFVPNMVFSRYSIVSPNNNIRKGVNGILVPQLRRTFMAWSRMHSSQPVGLVFKNRSTATLNLETQGSMDQNDSKSISLDFCSVADQMWIEDREPRIFGSNGSGCFFSWCNFVALSRSFSNVALLQFLQLKPPPGNNIQFSEGGVGNFTGAVVYSISRYESWQLWGPGTCSKLVGNNHFARSSLSISGQEPWLTRFCQLKRK